MVNDLEELMRANVAAPPPDHLDLNALVVAGRGRLRRRRRLITGGAAVLVVGAVAGSAFGLPSTGAGQDDATAARPPAPSGPVVRLADAQRAVEGRDYQVLAQHTNDNLDRENGQYFVGVTDDGMILYQDGPRTVHNTTRLALLDPATDALDWLPDAGLGGEQAWPVELTADHLVLLGGTYTGDDGMETHPVAHIFDRSTRQWSTVRWPSLPPIGSLGGVLGPDGRLYLRAPATQGKVPEGGWPVGSDGEADDADADGDTFHLWSVSLTDPDDVRDEGLTLGGLAFTDTAMVWTDSTNGDAGRVHVRDLASGEEHSFDPQAGEKCNLLSFGATGDRIVMGQYCGTYADEVRDDRVQILTTDGDQVVTLQDDGLAGSLAGTSRTGGVLTLTSYGKKAGTYVYDLATDRFLRLSDDFSRFSMGGPAPAGEFLWTVPTNRGHGAIQYLSELGS